MAWWIWNSSFLVGGVAAIGRSRKFQLNEGCIRLLFLRSRTFSWILVATNNLMYIYGILSSLLALTMMYRSVDFIFKDSGLVYQLRWNAKRFLPTGSMRDWDVRSARFAQNTMALKRFDSDSFAQIYGFRTKNGLVLRLDIFGIHQENRFDFRTLELNFDDFSQRRIVILNNRLLWQDVMEVTILLGSSSDMPVAEKCTKILKQFDVTYQLRVASAHDRQNLLNR